MTEVSNFQANKTSFTLARSVISSFAVCAYLVLGPRCIIVALPSRIGIKVLSYVLVYGLWSVLCISAGKV